MDISPTIEEHTMRARHNIRYNANVGRVFLPDHAERRFELDRLDHCIADAQVRGDRTILKIAKRRRRKVSGWVVGS